MNLPADPLPAVIVDPVAYIVPSTSRLYVDAVRPTPTLVAPPLTEPNSKFVPLVAVIFPPAVMFPPNTALPLVLSRVNLSVATAMLPLLVIDVTASIAPPIEIPVAVVVMRAASL